MIVSGIDPGNDGGLAFIDTDTSRVRVYRMPLYEIEKATKTAKGNKSISRSIDALSVRRHYALMLPVKTYIERVHSMPKQGVASAFNFGDGYGLVKGVLAGLLMSTELVTPQKWKKHFKITSDKDEARMKATSIAPACSQLWSLKRDDGLAEAFLLAYYGLTELLKHQLSQSLSPAE